jgi:hypothetical protein
MKIRTNSKPREILHACQLTEKEIVEFDYLEGESLDFASFFRYKGNVYDLGEFMLCPSGFQFKGWAGYYSDSAFSGILIKYCNDFEQVIVGQYFS